MRLLILLCMVSLFLNSAVYSDTGNPQVFRIGGMELPPYGFGLMMTQPHPPIDSTNSNFANYYVRISLWMGGISNAGDTLVTCADFTGLTPAAEFAANRTQPDTTNILQLPVYNHSYLSCYQDTAKGWFVKQYNLSLADYSYGIIVYEIDYNGKHGTLNQVYSGVKFDFDVPDATNWPTARDDELSRNADGFTIRDFSSTLGMEVNTLMPNTLKNYWIKENSPRNLKQVYEHLGSFNANTPQDTADYHFLLSRGPFILNGGETIVLAYLIEPCDIGLPKATAGLPVIQQRIKQFIKNKNLAKIDKHTLKRLDNANIPVDFYLFQNYPNPFNPETGIQFSLPEKALVNLEIFNALGQKIKTLVRDRWMELGNHTIHWNTKDNYGNPVASGVYLYRLKANGFQRQKKMLFIQ